MNRKVVLEIISSLFILLFVYAAVSKLLDYHVFVEQLGRSPLLSPFSEWKFLMGGMIPAVELCVAGLFFFPPFREYGLLSAFILMVVFTLYIIGILNFASYVPCTCGGILQAIGWRAHLIFNIVFTMLAVAGMLLQRDQRRRKDHIFKRMI